MASPLRAAHYPECKQTGRWATLSPGRDLRPTLIPTAHPAQKTNVVWFKQANEQANKQTNIDSDINQSFLSTRLHLFMFHWILSYQVYRSIRIIYHSKMHILVRILISTLLSITGWYHSTNTMADKLVDQRRWSSKWPFISLHQIFSSSNSQIHRLEIDNHCSIFTKILDR